MNGLGSLTFEVAGLVEWLPRQEPLPIVMMPPDAHELDLGPDIIAYRGWLRAAIHTCLTYGSGPTVIAVTDRLIDGRWVDKGSLVVGEAADNILWHKIILRRDVGGTDIHRPAYTHLIAIGPGRPGPRTPDVIVGGPRRWANGVGTHAAAFVADWFVSVGVTRVANPCFGMGTFADALRDRGVDVVACDVVDRDARLVSA